MAIDLKTLNPEQKKAVTHDQGPLLIVAGAGTGKTTVISQRVAWLIDQQKAQSNEILCLTFTEKAAAEMEERIDILLPYGFLDLWVSTFHAFAERILKQHALEVGLPNDFRLLNQTEQWLLVRQHLDKFKLDYYRPLGNPTKFIHALLKLFSRAKDEVITPEDYLKYAEELQLNADSADFVKSLVDKDTYDALDKKERKELATQEVARVQEVADAFHTYQQLLIDNNALDFGDLINYCLQLFKKRPKLLAHYRKQFKYILVDEFQDTNYAQYELIKLLAHPKNNVTVVGDDDQSIYKFRGASVSNILEFKRDYPKTTEIFLTKNYRSTQKILDLSYDFICQNNPNRLEVKLAELAKKKSKSKSSKTKVLSKKLLSQTKIKGTIDHLHFETLDDEVAGVIQKIAEIKQKDSRAGWGDFAILSRTNDVANTFAHGLGQTSIPYRFVASRGLYLKPVIQDVIAYLKLLDDYHENNAVYRILSSRMVGLAHRDLVNLNYWAKRKGFSLFACLHHHEITQKMSQDVRDRINQLLRWIKKHTDLAREKSISEVVVTFLEETGYVANLTANETPETVQATSYLNQFYKKIIEFERSSDDHSVKSFLELIELELQAGEVGSLEQDYDIGPESVKVMTVHAAKGLEFKYVFVVSLVDRRFPSDNRPDPIELPEALIKEQLPEGDAHLQEERRLFYVAMTRAKKDLYFTTAQDYGGARKKKISRFLTELEDLGFKIAKGEPEQAAPVDRGLGPVVRRSIDPDEIRKLLPRQFSFSQLRSFEMSPYQYWLEYILKIPQKGKNFFSFGSSLHNALQKFFVMVRDRANGGQQDLFGDGAAQAPVTVDDLLAIYEQSWIDDWYETREQHDEYFKKGKVLLKEFFKQYEKDKPVPIMLETPFRLTVHDDDKGEHFGVVGKIDRIDQLDGGVEIIDYKTGNPKSSLSTEDKRQLLIYQLAAQEHFGQEVKKLTYYYLENGEQLSFVGKEKDLENTKKWIIKTINDIRSYDFPPPMEDRDLNL